MWFGVVGGGLIWVQILDWPFYSFRKYPNPHTKPIYEREAVQNGMWTKRDLTHIRKIKRICYCVVKARA